MGFFAPCSRTYLFDNAAALVEGDDGLCRFVIQVQALLDGLLVVVRAPAGLAALHKPLDHGFGFGIDVQQQAGFADLQPKSACCRFKAAAWLQCVVASLTFFSNSSPCFTSRG